MRGDVEQLGEVLKESSVHSFIGKFNDTVLIAFDFVIVSDILNYVDYKKVIRDIWRYMVPGGRIFISNMAGVGVEMGFPRSWR